MAENQKPSPYKLKLWFAYTGEEKSYVVYNAYSRGILKSEDVASYLNKARLNHASNMLFPVFVLPLVKFGVYDALKAKVLSRYTPNALYAISGATLGALWLLWLNWSPLYSSFDRKREDLLELVERRVGLNLRQLNDILPRYWTEGEVNRKLRRLYNQRNGWLAGYVYPYEESATPLVDEANWAKVKKNRIAK